MKNKQQTPQRNLRRFALWGGDLEKERFVLRGGTLRFIFSERFVLRIIYGLGIPRLSENVFFSIDDLKSGLYIIPLPPLQVVN